MLADMSVNVLIAARHAATRAGIKAALERGGDRVVAECGDAADVADHALRARPDVCVVDLDLPGGGLTAVRAIAAQRRAPRILVLGSGARDDDVFAALRAGADGFVVKDVEPSRLAEQVAAVAAGDAVLSPNLMARLIAEFRAGERRATTRLLTLREEEALTLIGEGLTTKEVALRLSLAPTTVRRHLSTAAEKLGAGDRAAAVELFRAVQAGERK